MIDVVAGTRPNLVKVSPILREMKRVGMPHRFVWTGQHEGALDIRAELEMPDPDVKLYLGGIHPTEFLDAITRLLGHEWRKHPPRAVVVVGDVTSTLAATLAAVACRIPVVHVEAGLRSGDWEMPEERNRIIVDELAEMLLTANREDWRSFAPGRHTWESFVGNVMIDSLRWAREQRASDILERLGRKPGSYGVVTLHRPSNVDYFEDFDRSLRALEPIEREMTLIWPTHPRTRALFVEKARRYAGIVCIEPLPYVDAVTLLAGARLVATDSGGVQEETTALGVPCLTLRTTTERPITVTEGTNEVVGLDPERVRDAVVRVLSGQWKKGRIPEGWDGHAAERIVDAIARRYL